MKTNPTSKNHLSRTFVSIYHNKKKNVMDYSPLDVCVYCERATNYNCLRAAVDKSIHNVKNKIAFIIMRITLNYVFEYVDQSWKL